MAKEGRPKKDIDFDMVSKLCAIQCTGEEIAAILEVDYDTLNARVKEKFKKSFSDYFKKENERGKASLRRLQWKTAESGNVTMQIWLGKQYLAQSDKQETFGKNGGPIEHTIEVVLSDND